MVHFDEFLKTWSLRSNSVTRQVSFNRTKIGGKCQNWKIQSSCECENSSGGEASLGHRGLKMVKVLREKLALKPEFICASGARQNHNHHGAALQVSLLFEAFSLMLETAVKNWRLARFNLASIAPCARYRRSRIFCCCHFLLVIILRVSGSTKAIIHSRLELFSPLSPNEI